MILLRNENIHLLPSVNPLNRVTSPKGTLRHGRELLLKGATMSQKKCSIGSKFGRWSIIKHGSSSKKHVLWLCRCDCGVTRDVRQSRLLAGVSQSCGCLRNEHVSLAKKKHGLSENPIYSIWRSMIQRCTSESCGAYKNYGGRGIAVCDEWISSAQRFIEDMGSRPAGGSLERKNNSMGYNKDNCYWATRTAQANNTRANLVFSLSGETHTVAEWARLKNLNPFLIYGRLKLGWSFEDCITKPNRKAKHEFINPNQ